MSFVYLIEVRFSVLKTFLENSRAFFSFPLTVPGCACGWNLQVQGLRDSWTATTESCTLSLSAGSRLQELFTIMVNACNF